MTKEFEFKLADHNRSGTVKTVCATTLDPLRESAPSRNRSRAPTGWRLYTFLIMAVVLTGCGSGRSSVSGTLTLDGKPLAGSENVQVTIIFYPESGIGAPAAAMADQDGRYAVSTGSQAGLAPGNYAVALSATEYGTTNTAGGMPAKRVLTPARYANPKQSGLRAEVQPGRNTFDFDLQSDVNRRS